MNNKKQIHIAASILGSDLVSIEKAVKLCEKSDIDLIHIDVMDGHFVPDITFGNKFTADLKKITDLSLDVHLMVENPSKFIDSYADAGADSISFHIEADLHVHRTINYIKSKNIKAGISIIPSTPVSALSEIITEVDYIQVMTVNPGFSGQNIILSCIKKIEQLSRIRKESNLDFKIYVDGGVNRETSPILIQSGADVLITASAFFNSPDPKEEVVKIRN